MNDKPIIKLGAVKGKLIPVLQEYLKELELPPIENLRNSNDIKIKNKKLIN